MIRTFNAQEFENFVTSHNQDVSIPSKVSEPQKTNSNLTNGDKMKGVNNKGLTSEEFDDVIKTELLQQNPVKIITKKTFSSDQFNKIIENGLFHEKTINVDINKELNSEELNSSEEFHKIFEAEVLQSETTKTVFNDEEFNKLIQLELIQSKSDEHSLNSLSAQIDVIDKNNSGSDSSKRDSDSSKSNQHNNSKEFSSEKFIKFFEAKVLHPKPKNDNLTLNSDAFNKLIQADVNKSFKTISNSQKKRKNKSRSKKLFKTILKKNLQKMNDTNRSKNMHEPMKSQDFNDLLDSLIDDENCSKDSNQKYSPEKIEKNSNLNDKVDVINNSNSGIDFLINLLQNNNENDLNSPKTTCCSEISKNKNSCFKTISEPIKSQDTNEWIHLNVRNNKVIKKTSPKKDDETTKNVNVSRNLAEPDEFIDMDDFFSSENNSQNDEIEDFNELLNAFVDENLYAISPDQNNKMNDDQFNCFLSNIISEDEFDSSNKNINEENNLLNNKDKTPWDDLADFLQSANDIEKPKEMMPNLYQNYTINSESVETQNKKRKICETNPGTIEDFENTFAEYLEKMKSINNSANNQSLNNFPSEIINLPQDKSNSSLLLPYEININSTTTVSKNTKNIKNQNSNKENISPSTSPNKDEPEIIINTNRKYDLDSDSNPKVRIKKLTHLLRKKISDIQEYQRKAVLKINYNKESDNFTESYLNAINSEDQLKELEESQILLSQESIRFSLKIVKQSSMMVNKNVLEKTEDIHGLKQALELIKQDKTICCDPNYYEFVVPRDVIDREIMQKILDIFKELIKQHENGKHPSIVVVSTKTWSNVDLNNGRLTLKSKNVKTRTIKFTGQYSKRFNHIIWILCRLVDLIRINTWITKRELYYQMKTDFVRLSMDQVNATMGIVNTLLERGPWDYRIFAANKGLVCGDLTIELSTGEIIICNKRGGVGIPRYVHEIIKIHSNASFILVVEKDAVFQDIVNKNYSKELGCGVIVITAKGYPDMNTRLFLKKLWQITSVPVFALVDCDPYGIEIMLRYRFGSMAQAHLADHLALPQLRWLGVFPSDIVNYGLNHQKLTDSDRRKINNILKLPYIGCVPKLEDEISYQLQRGFKCNIESISEHPIFMYNTYIPHKLRTKSYI